MSKQLEDDFKTCIDRFIESRYEDDKINCCIMDLKSKVIREMATIHNNEYKQCPECNERVKPFVTELTCPSCNCNEL